MWHIKSIKVAKSNTLKVRRGNTLDLTLVPLWIYNTMITHSGLGLGFSEWGFVSFCELKWKVLTKKKKREVFSWLFWLTLQCVIVAFTRLAWVKRCSQDNFINFLRTFHVICNTTVSEGFECIIFTVEVPFCSWNNGSHFVFSVVTPSQDSYAQSTGPTASCCTWKHRIRKSEMQNSQFCLLKPGFSDLFSVISWDRDGRDHPFSSRRLLPATLAVDLDTYVIFLLVSLAESLSLAITLTSSHQAYEKVETGVKTSME